MPKRSNTGRSYGKAKRARTRRTGAVFRRRRRTRTKLGKPSRGLRQSTYLFKRQTTEVIPLIATGSTEHGWLPASGDGSDPGIFKQWQFSLSQLANADTTGATDFTALFKRYKIAAVKVELSFSNTASTVASVSGSGTMQTPNCQLQVFTTPNRSGRARDASNPLTEKELMHTQAKRKRLALNGGRPLKFYMRVNQLGMVYVSTTDTDYAVQRPQYISTGETGCVHYGLEMYINRVDGQALSTNQTTNQFMRCTTTYYLAFKGVE